MYLFNRSMRFGPGNLLDSMAWATRMTEKVNAVGGVEVHLWRRVLGSGIGTISWSTIVEDIAELTALEEKLMTDGGYLDLAEEGSRYTDGTGLDDTLGQLVHADPEGLDTAQYVSVTTTQLAPGMAAAGMALGVELAQMAKAITGRPTSFGSAVTGPYGQVAWFSLADTIEQVQAGIEALAADSSWIETIDARASAAYVAGVSDQFMSRKVV